MPLPDLATWAALWSNVTGGWHCADGYWSIVHPVTGHGLFVHGDTFLEVAGQWGMTRQSAVIWDGETLALTSDPRLGLVPDPDDTEWEWGGPMVWDHDLWMFSLRATRDAGGMGFRDLHPRSLLQFSWPSWGSPRFVRRWEVAAAGGIDWGAAVTRTAAYVYVYGTYHQPEWATKEWIFGSRVYLARVKPGNLSKPAAWEYYAGGKWSKWATAAVPVIHERDTAGNSTGTSTTFSAHHVDGGYRLVSKIGGDLGDTVAVWASATPWGPWTVKTVTRLAYTNQDQTYSALGHYCLGKLPDGRYLVSVAHNRKDVTFEELQREPKIYRATWYPTAA